MGIDLGGTGN